MHWVPPTSYFIVYEKLIASNKKAYHDYEVIETVIAGINLLGGEVKSIRPGKVSIKDSYCVFLSNTVFVSNFHIAEYSYSTNFSKFASDRQKQFLLNRRELPKPFNKSKQKGLTIIPLKLDEMNGRFKMELGLCRGLKLYDKRELLKERDYQRYEDE